MDSGISLANPKTLSFLKFCLNLPPFLTPFENPSNLTGNLILKGLSSVTSRKSKCKIRSVTGCSWVSCKIDLYFFPEISISIK